MGPTIYFVALDGKMMAVTVAKKGSALELGAPTTLFTTPIAASPFKPQYAVSRDGRFLANRVVADAHAPPITLILEAKLREARGRSDYGWITPRRIAYRTRHRPAMAGRRATTSVSGSRSSCALTFRRIPRLTGRPMPPSEPFTSLRREAFADRSSRPSSRWRCTRRPGCTSARARLMSWTSSASTTLCAE